MLSSVMNSPAVITIFVVSTVSARTFTVINSCDYTVWPAMFTDLNLGLYVPSQPTGWEAPSGHVATFQVPDDWKAGRIWGRKECDFSDGSKPGYLQCASGGCNGGLSCDPYTGTGVTPASVAEWTLEGDGDQDWYDVSLVDGFNVPMAVTNNVGCAVADCLADLIPLCPPELRKTSLNSTAVVGCNTACAANLDGDQTNSSNCCSGDFSTPDKCPPSGVQHYSFFKSACQNAYAYAYDESSKTALWKCPSELKADYTLTFCPPKH